MISYHIHIQHYITLTLSLDASLRWHDWCGTLENEYFINNLRSYGTYK